MRDVDVVIFDCDGVLVDSEPITNALLRDNLAGFGLDLPLEEVMALFIGGTMEGVRDRAVTMGAALPDNWVEDFYAAMFKALADGVEVIPGVPAVLDALDAAGVGYAVGSNGPHAKMKITLARTGLAPRLAGRVVSREDVARPKPAPDVYLHAAALCGADPARCVVIEDSVTGLRAGQAAGMRCLGFAGAGGAEALAPHAAAVFDDMVKLPGLLGLGTSAR